MKLLVFSATSFSGEQQRMAEKLLGKELGGVYAKNKNGGERINLYSIARVL